MHTYMYDWKSNPLDWLSCIFFCANKHSSCDLANYIHTLHYIHTCTHTYMYDWTSIPQDGLSCIFFCANKHSSCDIANYFIGLGGRDLVMLRSTVSHSLQIICTTATCEACAHSHQSAHLCACCDDWCVLVRAVMTGVYLCVLWWLVCTCACCDEWCAHVRD